MKNCQKSLYHGQFFSTSLSIIWVLVHERKIETENESSLGKIEMHYLPSSLQKCMVEHKIVMAQSSEFAHKACKEF